MIYSLFVSPDHAAFTDDVDDEQFSKSAVVLTDQSQFNVLYKKVEEFIGPGSYVVTPDALSDWQIVIARITGGGAQVAIAAKDVDGTTTINSTIKGYGTDLLPGVISLSTYNISTFTFSPIDTTAKVELFVAVAAADGDTRLITNA